MDIDIDLNSIIEEVSRAQQAVDAGEHHSQKGP